MKARNLLHSTASWIFSSEYKSKMWNSRYTKSLEELVVVVPIVVDDASNLPEIAGTCIDILGNDEDFFDKG
jgi:IMP cyclohydrolase